MPTHNLRAVIRNILREAALDDDLMAFAQAEYDLPAFVENLRDVYNEPAAFELSNLNWFTIFRPVIISIFAGQNPDDAAKLIMQLNDLLQFSDDKIVQKFYVFFLNSLRSVLQDQDDKSLDRVVFLLADAVLKYDSKYDSLIRMLAQGPQWRRVVHPLYGTSRGMHAKLSEAADVAAHAVERIMHFAMITDAYDIWFKLLTAEAKNGRDLALVSMLFYAELSDRVARDKTQNIVRNEFVSALSDILDQRMSAQAIADFVQGLAELSVEDKHAVALLSVLRKHADVLSEGASADDELDAFMRQDVNFGHVIIDASRSEESPFWDPIFFYLLKNALEDSADEVAFSSMVVGAIDTIDKACKDGLCDLNLRHHYVASLLEFVEFILTTENVEEYDAHDVRWRHIDCQELFRQIDKHVEGIDAPDVKSYMKKRLARLKNAEQMDEAKSRNLFAVISEADELTTFAKQKIDFLDIVLSTIKNSSPASDLEGEFYRTIKTLHSMSSDAVFVKNVVKTLFALYDMAESDLLKANDVNDYTAALVEYLVSKKDDADLIAKVQNRILKFGDDQFADFLLKIIDDRLDYYR